MNVAAKSPEACRSMTEVRAGVDAIDRALMDLLASRFGYMRAAARIKTTREAVRDEDRKRAVIEAAVADAADKGVPTDFVALMWETMVEASIAYETEKWDALRA
ncbi:chorismate mutase [Croceicoccus sp. BE223]|uniref:chorismate mutase n=1 Tax=Croceicoccus sp. BE223 TaxID=2817716 RepID=UPI00286CC834|nr:chorismate mutase [Croceicoccus sp. BE223]